MNKDQAVYLTFKMCLFFAGETCQFELSSVSMDIPPKQDSPKHIFNVLDDDCIVEILQRLDCADLLSVAQVCTQFQECAKDSFGLKLKCLEITYLNYECWTPNVFSIFGHLIHSINLIATGDRRHDNDIFSSIVQFCGETLRRLSIFNIIPAFNEQTSFSALEKFKLRIDDSQLSKENIWFVKGFPKLIDVELDFYYIPITNILLEFLPLNPQLQIFDVSSNYGKTTLILKTLADFAPNLEHLSIYDYESGFDEEEYMYDNQDIAYLSRLRKLKSLDCGVSTLSSIAAFINCFAENMIPLEKLVFGKNIEDNLTDKMLTLKSLKHVVINSYEAIPIEDFIKLLKSQTSLERIKVYPSSFDLPTLLAYLEEMLKYGHNLTQLACTVAAIDFNLADYKSIIDLTMYRINIRISVMGDELTINIPKNVLQDNRKWINIK